jgi:hypothetical protein
MITIIVPARHCPWEEENQSTSTEAWGDEMNQGGYKEKLFIMHPFLWYILLI